MTRYDPEIREYIAANCQGRYIEELTSMINAEFGTSFRKSQIKSYLGNHKLKTGMQHQKGRPREFSKCKYSSEVVEFLRKEAPGKSRKELAQMITDRFGIEMSDSKIKSLMSNNKITNGRDTRIKPGNIPVNKGTKGMFNVGGNKTSFKKGNTPHNWRPVGSERVNSDGYCEVKIAESNVWKLKHWMIWKEANGPIPEKHNLIFKDGNPMNCDLSNLCLVTKKENIEINRHKLTQRNGDPDLNMAGIQTGKLIAAIQERKKHGKVSRSTKHNV